MNPIINFIKKTDLFDRIGLGALVVLLIIFVSISLNKDKTNSQIPKVTPTPTSTPTTIPTRTKDLTPTKKAETDNQFVSTSTVEIVLTPIPTTIPTLIPTNIPTSTPTLIPTLAPTLVPTLIPTSQPAIIYPAGINVNTNNVTLRPGEKQQIIATVLPTNATNKNISWTYNGNIINVEPSGLITAKNVGRTTIIVSTSNNRTDLVYVTVDPSPISTSNPTQTQTPTYYPTSTPQPTNRPTNIPTLTKTPTRKPTSTPTPTLTPTKKPTPTNIPTATPTKIVNPSGVLLKMAVMSDIHNNTSGLKRMMRKSKDDGMNIVVLAGDLTTDGTSAQLSAAKKVLDDSGMRYESTEGNHDMRKSLFDDIFGESFQSIRFNGVKIILIDNSDYRGLDSGVLKGRGQKAWIESEVAECKKIICIGIMHMPLNHPTSGHIMGEEGKNAASEAIWLRKLLVSSGVKEIETGHIHHFATYTINGLTTNQVGPGTSSDFSEFIIYSSGKITRNKITL